MRCSDSPLPELGERMDQGVGAVSDLFDFHACLFSISDRGSL